jgi:Ca2+/H+ antiporter, TMEM165/GDT1 family
MGSGAVWGSGVAAFAASLVEMVEALTIVLAMGLTRGWRSTLCGVAAALVTLAGLTSVAGYALTHWVSEAALQLVVGALLLSFGLQWLRKAILRSAGRKAMHDEAAIFAEQEARAGRASGTSDGWDWLSFVVSFKGVLLEGLEVVFIVLTFGANAGDLRVAVWAAVAALVAVLVLAVVIRAPLTRVPENTLKYGVALLLTTFGTFWSIEGLGAFGGSGRSLSWLGGDAMIPVLLAAWFVLSRVLVAALRVPSGAVPVRPSSTSGAR